MWLVLGADVPSGAGSVKAGVRVGGRHAGNHKILAWNQIYVRGAVQGKQSGTEGGGGVAYLDFACAEPNGTPDFFTHLGGGET